MPNAESRPTSSGSLLQDVHLPGAYPSSTSLPVASDYQSLSQAVYARRAEYTRPKRIKIKVGTWNASAGKGFADVGGWFCSGQGVSESLTGLKLSDREESRGQPTQSESGLNDRESVEAQEERYVRKQSSLPKNDSGSLPGGDDIDLYLLGLQEIVDVNSASEALRPYTDPSVSLEWQKAVAESLPADYQLVAEQQLIGLLLLIYASKEVASDIKSVSTTSVGTGLMGYMGNKGAVTARLVLGETTRLVFINAHLAAGVDKSSLERRNWDYAQIVSRTRFDPIQDSMGLFQSTGETIGDEDIAFCVGDLNYRLEGIPGEDVRRLLMLHTRNEYDLSQDPGRRLEGEIDTDRAAKERKQTRSSIDSATSYSSTGGSSIATSSLKEHVEEAEILAAKDDPASLQTTLASLLPHDQLHRIQKERKAFQDWQEGPITFLPTYKYDIGSVGIFDSSEKRRAPSWCDRILYRSRRDRLSYEGMLAEEEESKRKDEEMRNSGIDQAGKDEELLYDYDPDEDAADDNDAYNEYDDALPGVVITKEGFEDELHLEYYTAHQRVLSSDHKPLEAIFSFKYDAVVPELKAKIHQEVARDLDRAENETRPSVTVVVDRHHPEDQEISDDDPAKFEGVSFGEIRYAMNKHRSLTIANTGRVPATCSFIDRPVGPGQSPGIAPVWLNLKMNGLSTKASTDLGKQTLEPGDAINVEMQLRILDVSLARAFNEGIEKLEDILVLRVENGRDHFIPLRGIWLESSLGHSIDKLIRIPEGGIRKLQRQKPDSSRGRAGSAGSRSSLDQPVKWSAPRELFRLTEGIEDLTIRSVAEWGMVSGNQGEKAPWDKVAGWPFAEDPWSSTDPDQRHESIASMLDSLDSDVSFDKMFPPSSTPMETLESMTALLLLFLQNMPDGVITEQIWKQIDVGMIKNDKERNHPSREEQRTWIQEVLSQDPAHSISFILLTAMMDRIINEVTSINGSANDKQPPPEAPVSLHPDRSLKKNTSRSSAKKTEKSGRLGKNELGPYAHEDRMPQWLYDDLKRGGPVRQVNRIGGDGKLYRESFVENEVKHTVTALSVLSNISDTVVRAYFCHSEVQHVFKRKYEGGFCGYRNIQMLFSYLQAVKDQKWEHSATRVPGVLEIQDIIEDAWDHGVDDLGRIQTGGVKGTRKWIGTPEALTVFRHLDVPCRIESYSTTEEAPAYESILNHIEAYFDSGYFNAGNKVCSTKLPPIYLQQPGHSLTIVGLERHKNGSRYLLVLDPSFGPSHGVQQLAMTKKLPSSWNDSTAQKLLKPYRRGRTQLSKYAEFETLEIVASSSLSST
ncbi:hypothetical protein MBLNU459_g8221t2 [Dothideomycetes sp. NU459]